MKLILWRIPRTGTTSIRLGLKACGLKEGSFANPDGADFVSDGHVQPRQALERQWFSWGELEHAPQLIIVRHPAERLVSTWSLFQQAPGLIAERYHPRAPKTWDKYIEWCCKGERATEYHQVNYQCWPAIEWFILPAPDGFRFMPRAWKLRSEMIRDADLPTDMDCPDRVWRQFQVFRYEDLHAAWDWLMDLLKPLQREQLPFTNASQHGDARDYFTAQQRSMVSQTYAWEMETFDYGW